MKYCSQCGGPIQLQTPEGDDRNRHICTDCNTIHYQNPRIITGCIPVQENRILLCRRAIEPRQGLWTLPAGFLENGEATHEGALRESFEEANARLSIQSLYTVIDIPQINQVYMFFLADFLHPEFSPGAESLEVELFQEQDIPWPDIAFPVVEKTLRLYFSDRKAGRFPLRTHTMRWKSG